AGVGLEGVSLEGDGGGGVAVFLGAEIHGEGALLAGAGVGAGQEDGAQVVGAIVLRQADGFGLGANSTLGVEVGEEVHTAGGNLVIVQGFHIAAQVVGHFQGEGAVVDPRQGVGAGDGKH